MNFRINKKYVIYTVFLSFIYGSTYGYYSGLPGMLKNIMMNVVPNTVFFVFSLPCLINGFGKKDKLIFQIGLLMPIVATVYTGILWIFNPVSFRAFTRLCSTLLGIILYTLGAIGLCRKFKEKSVDVLMDATIFSCFITYIRGIIDCGIGDCLNYIVHFYSYSDGNFIKSAEMHQQAYVLGALLLYYFFGKKDSNKADFYRKLYGLIFFILSYKRIGLFGFIIAVFFAMIFNAKMGRSIQKTIRIFGFIIPIATIVYVSLVCSGWISEFLSSHNIHMMGRDVLNSYFAKLCTYTPSFMGYGFSYVSKMIDGLTREDVGSMFVVKGLHNDIFRIYIEMGYLGSFAWHFYNCWIVPTKMIKKNIDLLNIVFVYILLMIYSYITYTTDNTFFYPTLQFSILVIVGRMLSLATKNSTEKL